MSMHEPTRVSAEQTARPFVLAAIIAAQLDWRCVPALASIALNMCDRYVSSDEATSERELTLVSTEWQFPA
jgi:hypothetical protein